MMSNADDDDDDDGGSGEKVRFANLRCNLTPPFELSDNGNQV